MNKKLNIIYVIQPEYLNDIAALRAALDFKRTLDYCIDQGSKDDGVLTGLNKLSIENCLEIISNRERWPKVLNGGPYLKENGYQNDLLDDLYK
jgi:hypothetical protein